MTTSETLERLDAVAIIGMTCRFPGARNIDQFWKNLRDGVESVTFFTDQQLAAAGVKPALLSDPHYVKARPVLADVELFDAAFFKINPREAEVMDPQHRIFLECAWEALENAGYNSELYAGRIGVYAGAEQSSYLLNNLITNRDLLASVDGLQVVTGTDRGYLSTRVSYELNLRGPSISVQTSCSTSLVAVHLACENLLNGECDIALAGGVTVSVPQTEGYYYNEGGIASPDGHCRAFDARAQGTLFGSGVGLVVLKRLEDALADGDCIHAVVRGSAINNDGALKTGYTAPSVDGQAAAIAEALNVAQVKPDAITYVEAHGTGTELGDPVEIAALNKAFRFKTDKKDFCAIGSVKSNVGHLAAAAGMAGLIKTVLALKHKQIPPSLHFEQPNPKINFEDSPFFVNATLREWQTDGAPRRAGISSFGMGGTNAHVVLEEAPPPKAGDDSRPWHLLLLSAKTEPALEQATDNLAAHLKEHPGLDLADVAYTLQVGRRTFDYRRALACRTRDDALAALESRDPKRVFTSYEQADQRPVAFMFPGLGDQYPNMARGLYQAEPLFRTPVDRCCELLRPHLGLDLREVLFPDDGLEAPADAATPTMDFRRMLGRGGAEPADAATQRLNRTSVAHPALFVVEYALAQLLMAWGVQPRAVIGHSIGEYVAACVAGVLSPADALTLVARRAQMIEALPGGAMLGVPLSEQEVAPLLGEELSLSAINGPQVCVLAGPEAAIAELERTLLAQDVACRRVASSHAFHSHMLDPIVAPLTELVKSFDLKPPQIPYVSNLTGTWITDEQATDPRYWGRHSRHPVRFADGIGELWQDPDCFLLEVGPGHTLSTMALQHPAGAEALERVLSTVRHAYEPQADLEVLLGAVGQLWIAGVPVDWEAFHGKARRLRVPLPTYPFERQRYWIEPRKGAVAGPDPLARRDDVADWFYIPSWKRTPPPPRAPRRATGRWLLFEDGGSLSRELARQLQASGDQVITVSASKQFAAKGDTYTLRPAQREDYEALLAALGERDQAPGKIVHLWNVAPPGKKNDAAIQEALQHGFYSLLFLIQALEKQDLADGQQLTVVSSHVQSVTGEEVVSPERATLLGPCKVLPHELPHVTCHSIDVAPPASGSGQETWLVERIIAEIKTNTRDLIVAYRGGNRWVQTYEPAALPEIRPGTGRKLRKRGVYLITGALSDTGLALAQCLARTAQPRLILLTPLRLPPIAEWAQDLATRDPQDPIGLRMRAVQELEALGAEVLLLRADVTSPAQVGKAVRLVREQYGTIHGVIHAAGATSGERICSETPASAAGVLGPKVQGAQVLEAALRDVAPDFVLLCSSLTALVGGSGRATACAAGAFLDALAHARWSYNGTRVTSINWDAWAADEKEQTIETFHRLLAQDHLPQVAVCARHLPTLIARSVELQPTQAEDDGKEPVNLGAEHPRPNLPTAYAAPSSQVEQELAGIWQRLLGIGKVGRNDSFFRLGGHSLVAIQLINRVRDTFEVEMDLRSSFEAPTIAELAERIEQARQAAQQGKTLAITPVPRDGALPLSLAQQQLWVSQQARPGGDSRDGKAQERGLRRLLAPLRRTEPKTRPASPPPIAAPPNLVATLRLAGRLDLPTLERGLNEVVRRHEVLRTTFVTVDGRPVQVFAPASPVTLPLLDLQALPEEERERRVQVLVAGETRRPFDPARGPSWRAVALRLSDQMHTLLLSMHRLISDERSVEILIQELAALYEADTAGKPSPLPELVVQYADFAAWQWAWLQGGALESQLAYWRQQLGGPWPALALPADRPRSAATAFPRARHPLALSPALTEALRALGQQQGNTLFITLLAAFKALLYHLTGQPDIIVGTPVVNRNRSEVEELIGPFGNTLALRTDLAGNPTFNELLERVREVTLGAHAHQDLPFTLLLKELAPDRPPRLPVTFVLQNEPLETLVLPELTLSALEIKGRGGQSDLTLALEDTTTSRSTGLTTSRSTGLTTSRSTGLTTSRSTGLTTSRSTELTTGLRGALEYNAASFDAATIARLASDFQTLLENVVAVPERRLAELRSHDEPQPMEAPRGRT